MRALKVWVTAALCLGCAHAGHAESPAERPAVVAVVDCPVAERWLARAGVHFTRRSGDSLGVTPLTGIRLLILPVEAVATEAAARSIAAYVADGGRVVAAYWGTLMPQGGAASPAYHLTELLGVRPVGWMGEAPLELVLADIGAGVLPSSGARVALPPGQATVVTPLAGAHVVARWSESEGRGALLPAGRSEAVVLRGGAIYLTLNLFRAANDRPETRELFFWAVQRVAADLGPGIQARDRIASAAEACTAAQALLPMAPPPELRASMDAAQAALVQARAALARSPVRASQAADRARALAERLADRFRAAEKG